LRLSLVVITHDRPDALRLVLAGVARQRVLPSDVVVTEDGASPATRACVDGLRPSFPVPLVHVTQEHRGPRMSRARNRGVAAARGEYVVFLDGDMVPAREFVRDHRDFARRGSFVQGSRALASPALTERLLLGEGRAGGASVSLFTPGVERRRHLLRAPPLRDLWGRPHRRRGGAKSCNFAFWRDDLLALNGFEEAMSGWGLEDAELVQRAFHLGLWRRDLRLGAGAVHLWHPPHVLGEDNPNWAVLREVEASRRVRSARGLEEHLRGDPRAVSG
jgi:glycosyltransferase involved in cell wall biosynthesis